MKYEYAAIFDMDGVLIDTYHAHYQSWLEMVRSQGLDFPEDQFARTFGRTSREIIDALWGKGRLDDAQIAHLDACKEAAFRRIIEADFPAMPGAQTLLQQLHEAGFGLAIGSSGPPENVELTLDKLAARPLFQAVVNGMDVTRGKPDPQVFLIAAQRLGTPPSQCVVLEDAPVGVAAAQAAGMASIGLVSTGRTRRELSAAHLVVNSLAELSPSILRLLIDRGRT